MIKTFRLKQDKISSQVNYYTPTTPQPSSFTKTLQYVVDTEFKSYRFFSVSS